MKKILPFSLVCCGLIFAAHANAAKLYKWVDKNGVVSYQDRPPPSGSKILEETTTKEPTGGQGSGNQSSLDPVRVYTVADCDMCSNVVQRLKKLDVPVIELSLQNDREAQSIILERSNSLVAPTVFIGEEMLQGSSVSKLEQVLEENGYKIAKPEVEKDQAPRNRLIPKQVQELQDGEGLIEG